MHILFIGDIMGRPGAMLWPPTAASQSGAQARFHHRQRRERGGRLRPDARHRRHLFATGIDCITTGNHWADQKEILSFIDDEDRILRPRNYPAGTPGKGAGLYETRSGARVLVMNAMGRTFMEALDDPFASVEAELAPVLWAKGRTPSWSTSMPKPHRENGDGTFLRRPPPAWLSARTRMCPPRRANPPGRHRLSNRCGACADYDSVIGMEKYEPVQRFVKKMHGSRFTPAMGPATLCAVFAATNAKGFATRIEPLRIGGRLKETRPAL